VWFDALSTYISAVEGEGLWPADLHLIGKEIVRFHAIYWPAFLMAADLPLPKRIFAHGWLLFENDKMSKSRGNIVRATPIHRVLGTDALRYFLLREVVFGQDGSFSYDALVGRYNSDLANGLGNLASRTLTMIHQYRGGIVPAQSSDQHIAHVADVVTGLALETFGRLEFSRAIEHIGELIAALDKFIVERAPWKLAKSEDTASQDRLDQTLYTAAEALRIVTALLSPVIPESAAKIWSQLGFAQPIEDVRIADLHWGQLRAGQVLGTVAGVFPRADAKASIAKMQEFEFEELARQKALLGQREAAPATPPASTGAQTDGGPLITIDDFSKVELRVGIVKEAAPVKGADKLLYLQVDIGEARPRSIVAGIATAYKPDALIGRKVVIVANLQPRKLRGLESQGMIVAASLEGGSPVLAGFLEDVPVGARLK
jgi:methionyl-tRNA synthetase